MIAPPPMRNKDERVARYLRVEPEYHLHQVLAELGDSALRRLDRVVEAELRSREHRKEPDATPAP